MSSTPLHRLQHFQKSLPMATTTKASSSAAFAIIAGVGPGTGSSIARKFATTYPVVLLARNAENYEPLVAEINGDGGRAVGISTDVADAGSVEKAFGQIEREFTGAGAGLAAAVFNVGGRFVRKPFLEMGLGEFEAGFEANGWGFFSHFSFLFFSVASIRDLRACFVWFSSCMLVMDCGGREGRGQR